MANVLIATPTMGSVRSEYLESLLRLDKSAHNVQFSSIGNTMVYEARNQLVLHALEKKSDYILFIDSDMVFEPDMLNKLVSDAEYKGASLVTGITFTRSFPVQPTFLKSLYWKSSTKHHVAVYHDYPKDDLFKIGGCGMAACLVCVDMIAETAEVFDESPFTPLPGLSEDYSFCWRLGEMGGQMYCDSSVKVGHVGTMIYDERLYLATTKDKT